MAFALFMIGFTLANARFLDPDNVMGVIRSSAILGVMALGVTFVVISGNLDLSVGSMMSFSTIVVLDLHDKIGPALAIPGMFAMTLCLGAFIGFLVGYLKLNSLIVTLGMLSAIHGLTLTYSGGKNMDIDDKAGTWFSVFGRSDALGIPVPILIFLLLALLLGTVLAKTPFGRKIYAVGGNGTAATFSGIPRARVVFSLLPRLGVLRGHRRALAGQPLDGVAEHRGPGARARGARGGDPRGRVADGRGGHDLQDGDRRADPRLHPERAAAGGAAVLCPVCRDLDHHHPRGLARYRGQAWPPLVPHRVNRSTEMTPGTLSRFLKRGAIWGFIVFELIFFSVAGEFLSLSENAFMDADNMLLLFKQSAPIGIIAMGMTIVMINGNIDLSVGATYALCAVVLLDSMTWPFSRGSATGSSP